MDNDAAARRERIRALNDELRKTRVGGRIVFTPGVVALGLVTTIDLLDRIAAFDNFNADNDPHEEHDCAVIQVAGATFIWKIDYYDLSLTCQSPDPADPLRTERVLTVMLSSEY